MRECNTCKNENRSYNAYPCDGCLKTLTKPAYIPKDMEEIKMMLELKEEDVVNHPKHYEREGAIECIDEMLLIFGVDDTMAFCKLNAWKYRYRAADKNGSEDISKSDWYMNKYKELKEKAKTLRRENY